MTSRISICGFSVLGFALAALMLTGMAARHAQALPIATASPASSSASSIVQRIANVCGTNGCVRVQTQRVRHQKPGSVPAKHI
jgi:hypothetical protein